MEQNPLIKDIRTVPNLLTLLRLLATVPLYLLISSNHLWIGLGVFLIGAVLDALDGLVARGSNQVTEFGKIFDPFADKVFFLAALFILTPSNLIWMWWVLFALEWKLFAGSIIGAVLLYKYNKKWFKLGANVWGKTKIHLEVSLILLLFVDKLIVKVNEALLIIVFVATTGLALMSIVGHIKSLKLQKNT